MRSWHMLAMLDRLLTPFHWNVPSMAQYSPATIDSYLEYWWLGEAHYSKPNTLHLSIHYHPVWKPSREFIMHRFSCSFGSCSLAPFSFGSYRLSVACALQSHYWLPIGGDISLDYLLSCLLSAHPCFLRIRWDQTWRTLTCRTFRSSIK